MRSRSRLPLFLVVLIAAVLALFFFVRRTTQAAFGPPVALCPGPDLYGYTCESGAGYAYIEATQDTQLYQDDGLVTLELPFPFTFYGTTYTELEASVNGNLQFGNRNPMFLNSCLDTAPAAGMGDMIAAYWDDLDLSFSGFLETEVVGTAPERIFVVEWDEVPRFGDDPEDRVTFEVQLFEGSNDIVILYQDAGTLAAHNGRNATIGLQSGAQGIALQYGCDQSVVANASGIRFPAPARPNSDIGQRTVISREATLPASAAAKGLTAELLTSLQGPDQATLAQLRSRWLAQSPPHITEWHNVDLTGDGRAELVVLWHSRRDTPELTQLAVIGKDRNSRPILLLGERPSTRAFPVNRLELLKTADLTGDGHNDLLLTDASTDQLFVIAGHDGQFALYPVPERCHGSLALLDTDKGRPLEIVRDGCDQAGRVSAAWDGRGFSLTGQ